MTSPCRQGGAPGAAKPGCFIHVVTAENRKLYADEMEAIFRLRHRVYVEERGWSEFRSPDGRQVDPYDTSETVYLLAIEPEKQAVVGGCRLLPTTGQPLLQEFEGLKGGYPLPRSPDVLHLSRFVGAKQLFEGALPHVLAYTILAGVQEYGLAEDVAQLSALSRVYWLPVLLQLGWNPQPLALPEMYRGQSVIVSTWDISEVAHHRTCALLGVDGPLLVRRGISRRAAPMSDSGRHS